MDMLLHDHQINELLIQIIVNWGLFVKSDSSHDDYDDGEIWLNFLCVQGVFSVSMYCATKYTSFTFG